MNFRPLLLEGDENILTLLDNRRVQRAPLAYTAWVFALATWGMLGPAPKDHVVACMWALWNR